MKLPKIAISRTHNRKHCLFFPLTLGAMIWSAALQVQAVSAQARRDIVSSHGDLTHATERDPSLKSFVEKHSKAAKKRSSEGSVHVVYLVPADKARRDDYAAALEEAIQEIQAFYQDELGVSRSKGGKTVGETFDTFKPTVEIVVTSHDSAYYNANNQAGPFEFFFRAVGDGFEATGGGFNDPDAVWVYYIDADPACGQGIGGTSGVALLPANDLRGLVGEPNVPPCIGDPPDTSGVCRWIGGLGHELGHALGLPHPPGCEQGTCSAEALFSLMFFGYIVYPDTYFLDEDKERLEASPFFEERKIRRQTNCLGEPFFPTVNNLVTLDPDLDTSFSPTPVPDAPAGIFTIGATFTNTSGTPLRFPFFTVTELSGGNLLLNAEEGPRGVGATVTPNVGDQVLSPGETVNVDFVIGLQTSAPFTFLVDLFAEPLVSGAATSRHRPIVTTKRVRR